ncbi:hypothetical protein [Amycolatopsis taiwanensis]|uniref:hypothetical protein n=1 Tax=Amycolatopsis taiwanensis TaxID=342230 RepID=UPI0004B33416|nr:hypothetical protein [Amycolatopsis taiwanensis]
MSGGQALLLAGSGMLAGVAEALVSQGWHVVLPSRRYSPIPAPETKPGIAALRALRPPGHTRQGDRSQGDWEQGDWEQGDRKQGRAIWVQASWDSPWELARKAEAELSGQADLLVSWVHSQYRPSVMRAVEPLLAADAPVVEVSTIGQLGPPDQPEPSLGTHRTQVVLLGLVSETDSGRALGQDEIISGVRAAVCRALSGQPASVHQIGRLRPMLR